MPDPIEAAEIFDHIIVTGEGSFSVAPDYARITRVTTRAKTIKEVTNANAKVMVAITTALLESGVAQKDIHTSRSPAPPPFAIMVCAAFEAGGAAGM